MDKETRDAFRKIDQAVVKGILADKALNNLLRPFFAGDKERVEFIRKCLARIKTRKMLLTIQEYVEIADGMEKVKQNHPALKLIFLMSFAESTANERTGMSNNDPLAAIKEFFEYISKEDKQVLHRRFTRALLRHKTNTLRFSSVIRIFYDIRNKAVHGEDFWSFSLLRKEEKEQFEQENYTDYGILTSGLLGKRGRKRNVPLDIALTYEELRDIFIRTAVANIRSLF